MYNRDETALAELERICGEKGIQVIVDNLRNDYLIFRNRTKIVFIDLAIEKRHVENFIDWLMNNM